jgi:hypothetical protein
MAQLFECDHEARIFELLVRWRRAELGGVFEVGECGWGVAGEACTGSGEEETGEACAIVIVPARAEWATEMLDRLELLEGFAWAALLVGELRECEPRGDVTRVGENAALKGAVRFDRAVRLDEARDVDGCGGTHAARGRE